MEIRNLITFIYVAELNSFSKAATTLGYSQSTVSFQIKQLEEELQCLLFERINHSITLTDKGKALLSYAHNITNLTEEFKKNFTDDKEISGYIHIIAPDSICEKMMLNHYSQFYKQHPKISLKFSTGDTSDMFKSLDHNEADIIITLDSHVYNNDYIIIKEEKVSTHLVTNAKSDIALNNHLKFNDLINYPFILTEKNMGYRRVFDRELAKNHLQIEPILEISRTDLITKLLESNVNVISFLPDFVTDQAIKEGKLVYLDVDDFKADIWKQLIRHKNKWLSKHLNTFIDYLIKNEFK